MVSRLWGIDLRVNLQIETRRQFIQAFEKTAPGSTRNEIRCGVNGCTMVQPALSEQVLDALTCSTFEQLSPIVVKISST